MTRRLRADLAWYEGRKAEVRRSRTDRQCDVAGCECSGIKKGDEYAYINTGLSVCALNWAPEDVETVP